MSRDVITVPPTATVADALDVMEARGIRHLIVVEGGGLVGVLSDRDLRMAVTGRPADTAVQEVMSNDPFSVLPGERIDNAARIMNREGVGCLPVLEDGHVVGLLTASDLIRAFVEVLDGSYQEPEAG